MNARYHDLTPSFERKVDTDSVIARYDCLSNNTRNRITERNNSKIYFMHIIITGCNKGATNRGEAVYLLFPVNFSVQHEYFVFFLVLFKDREDSYEDFDFSIITPIIDSFRIKYRG